MLKVLIDATAMPRSRGGVGRYVDYLVGGLAGLDVALGLAAQQRDAEIFSALAPRARLHLVPQRLEARPARMAWEQTGLPLLARRWRPDVIHSPHYTRPILARVPSVVTIHDATFFTDPEVHQGAKGVFFRRVTADSVAHATRLIAPSRATRDELVKVLGPGAERIDVVPHGVDTAVFHRPAPADEQAFRREAGIGERRYIAFLGTLEPRKNIPALIRGYAAAFAGRDDPPLLLLAGAEGWDHTIGQAVAELSAPLEVRSLGYVPYASLPAFLGSATIVAYPSLAEGFGLPVLEAMACGAAVLTTNSTSLPEVGGDAVAYTEPDPASIGRALAELDADRDRRRRLSEAAVARAAEFTWERTARRHLDVYRAAASAGGRGRQ